MTQTIVPSKSLEARSAGMQQSLVCGVTKKERAPSSSKENKYPAESSGPPHLSSGRNSVDITSVEVQEVQVSNAKGPMQEFCPMRK
jgi:hypothetical protein